MDKLKRRIRRANDLKYKKHLESISKANKNWLFGAYLYKGTYKNPREEKNWYYRKISRGSRSAYLKKLSNRAVRRYKYTEIKSGNSYRKIFDYWYELI